MMFQNKEKISAYQAAMLVIGAGLGTIFTFIAIPAVKYARQDGWLAVLIAYAAAVLLGFPLMSLGRRFPDKTFVQYLPMVIGKILGKLAALAYILIFWITTPIVYRLDMEVIRYFLPNTPPILIIIFFSILVVYCMKKGFEVFARIAELFSLVMVVFILLLLVMILPQCDPVLLTPFLENGFMPVLRSFPILFPFAAEGVLFMALWFPCMNKVQSGKKSFFLGMTAAAIVMTATVAVTIAFAGPGLIPSLPFPTLNIAQNIQFHELIYGVEAVFMLLWIIASTIQQLTFTYPSVVGLAQWFNLREYKHAVIPVTAVSVILAMVPSNFTEVMLVDTLKNPYLFLPLALLIPITWMIAAIRKLDESKR